MGILRDFVLLSLWEGKRSRCLFLCSSELFQWLGKVWECHWNGKCCKPVISLSFTACFPQIPCNHGSVIKQPLIFQSTQQRRSLTEGLVLMFISISTLLWLQALGVWVALRQSVLCQLKSPGNVSTKTPDRKWNQKCMSKRAAVYRDEQIFCQTHPFHLCLGCVLIKNKMPVLKWNISPIWLAS